MRRGKRRLDARTAAPRDVRATRPAHYDRWIRERSPRGVTRTRTLAFEVTPRASIHTSQREIGRGRALSPAGRMAKKVLIVDDSASMRSVINMTLTGAGYDVIEASDGQNGLSHLDGQKLNLIITDINMPVMDGLTFVKEVKKHAAYKFTPIIVLTTETDQAKRDQARASGAKAWVVKPFQPQQMLDAVTKLVSP